MSIKVKCCPFLRYRKIFDFSFACSILLQLFETNCTNAKTIAFVFVFTFRCIVSSLHVYVCLETKISRITHVVISIWMLTRCTYALSNTMHYTWCILSIYPIGIWFFFRLHYLQQFLWASKMRSNLIELFRNRHIQWGVTESELR